MQSRFCPNCGFPWFSADTVNVWICGNCGCKIPPLWDSIYSNGGEVVKAISILQPWASLIAIGAKKIETRSWPTRHRGPLAIHASKKYTYGMIGELCRSNPIWHEAMKSLGVDFEKGFRDAPLPHGAVIATCNLVDCKMIVSMPTVAFNRPDIRCYIDALSKQELAFGDYAPGRYALILEDVKMLPVPIPAKGRLGLWDWEVPEVVSNGS